MIDIQQLRKLKDPKIVMLGNHPGTIQSVLDFDYLSGKPQPSVVAVVGANERWLRFFWGNKEVAIPAFASLAELDPGLRKKIQLFAVAQSGRRAAAASQEAIELLPNVLGGMIFAEGVPERHALALKEVAEAKGKFMLGPASVGLTIGGQFKLGAIGGTMPEQIVESGIYQAGPVAVISSSGGMVNELISLVGSVGSGISFAAAIGGERFPMTSPKTLIEQALKDKATQAIVYFGELGGADEYEVAELIKTAKIKKPLIAYIAGTIAEQFEQPPQFGHAKALAQGQSETASAKRQALAKSGATVAKSFADFENKLAKLPKITPNELKVAEVHERFGSLFGRAPALFVDRISTDKGGEVQILGEPLVDFISSQSLSEIVLSMFLGHAPRSAKFSDFIDTCLRLLVDHGPQVSGAVNTMITARAGKDLSASLAAGILTVGPRFGGAINGAAQSWFEAVNRLETPENFVEQNAQAKQYIPGIGHRKYRTDNPDPRVALLLSKFDAGGKYTAFAKQVAAITTKKKAQLILNVDGAIAALLLDILSDEERYTNAQISQLLKTDFCNAIFIYARSAGFIAHHLEQQRLDEGLFRLPDDYMGSID